MVVSSSTACKRWNMKKNDYRKCCEEKREIAQRALKYEREKEENGKTQEPVEEGAEA